MTGRSVAAVRWLMAASVILIASVWCGPEAAAQDQPEEIEMWVSEDDVDAIGPARRQLAEIELTEGPWSERAVEAKLALAEALRLEHADEAEGLLRDIVSRDSRNLAALVGVAELLATGGRLVEAEAFFRQLLQRERELLASRVGGSIVDEGLTSLYRAYYADDPLVSPDDFNVKAIVAAVGLARVIRDQGRLDEAKTLLRESHAILQEFTGPDSFLTTYAQTLLEDVSSRMSDATAPRAELLNWERDRDVLNRAINDQTRRLERQALMEEMSFSAAENGVSAEATNRARVTLARFLIDPLWAEEGGEAEVEAEALLRETLCHDAHQADALSTLAGILTGQSRHEEAEVLARDALAVRRRTLKDDDPAVFETVSQLADLLIVQRKYEEAEPLLREVLSFWTAYEELHDNDFYAGGQVQDYTERLSDVLMAQGRVDQAEQLRSLTPQSESELRQAIEQSRSEFGEADIMTMVANNALLRFLVDHERGVEAEVLARELFERVVQAKSADDSISAMFPPHAYLAAIGGAQSLQGRQVEALNTMTEAYELARAQSSPGAGQVEEIGGALAILLLSNGRAAEAEPLFSRHVAFVRQRAIEVPYLVTTRDVADSLLILAKILQDIDRFAEAEALAREALDMARAELGPRHPASVSALSVLGELLKTTGRVTEAESLLREAIAGGFAATCDGGETRRLEPTAQGYGAYRWNDGDPDCRGSSWLTRDTDNLASIWATDPGRIVAATRLYSHTSDMAVGRTRMRYARDPAGRTEFNRFRHVHGDFVTTAWASLAP